MPRTLIALLSSWQAPPVRVSTSTLLELRVGSCIIFEGRSDSARSSVALGGSGEVGVDLSSTTSMNTSRSSSSIKPMCLSVEAKHPTFMSGLLSSQAPGSKNVGVEENVSYPLPTR